MNINDYMNDLFKEYDDVVTPIQLKEMLGNKIGTNKIYSLLKTNQIESKKIGNNYYIPKINVIKYLLNL